MILLLIIVLLAAAVLCMILALSVVIAFAPGVFHQQANIGAFYDVIIILGCPATADGKPSATMRSRMAAALEAYQGKHAAELICSGGSAHNAYPEADVMAGLAEASGVAAEHVHRETRSANTYENIANSVQMMKDNGWKSALIVTSPWHLRRAGCLAANYPIRYGLLSSRPPKQLSVRKAIVLSVRENCKIIQMKLGRH
ncbi:YdcF family protein [Sporolactobacillus vineae]|uniref:YdcF family protein n=1 Tax=Sporolactobacillus vineae TaxID=444463 RepID=UPI0002894EDB|nr:YdcF family protein [Sporolactobacillus vineae]